MRVLVVDDDVLMCRFLECWLRRRGVAVVCETSPSDALERLALESFDVVVSDVNMEGLDGVAFSQRVSALHGDLPVILITGSATLETAVTAVRSGAWDFLAKPIDATKLMASLDRACEHYRLRKELRELRAQLHGADFSQALPASAA